MFNAISGVKSIDLRVATEVENGLWRRFRAAVTAVLCRRDVDVDYVVDIVRTPHAGFEDHDVQIRWWLVSYPTTGTDRLVHAEGVFAFHVTNTDRVEWDAPLYSGEWLRLVTTSADGGAPTEFSVNSREEAEKDAGLTADVWVNDEGREESLIEPLRRFIFERVMYDAFKEEVKRGAHFIHVR